MPIGNLTSQIFANIYLNELDYFIKHKLRIKYYLRYADDFIILSNNKQYLQCLINTIQDFLNEKLRLTLHPNKITIRKLSWGIDFVGTVVLPHYSVIRAKTKRRMFKRIDGVQQNLSRGEIGLKDYNATLQSYLGLISHSSCDKIKREIYNINLI